MSLGDALGERNSLADEDAARANLYALIGRLFHDAPDSILLAQLCSPDAEPTGDATPLERAWRALRDACNAAYPAVMKQEYDTLFVGVGKSEVTPFTSHYIRGNAPELQLVRLRQRLEQLGLGRRTAAFEVEDHVSGLCDVMRILIEDGHPLAEQRLFFNEFLYSGGSRFCDAVATATSAAFYRRVAEFARAFLDVEQAAFDMDEADG